MIRFDEYSPPGICYFFGLDIAAVAAIASVAVAAGSAIATGVAASKQQEFQADVANMNADLQTKAANAEAERVKIAGERRLAMIGGTYRKAGIDPSVGSPVDVLAESAGNLELDVAMVKYAGKIGALQSNLQGTVARKNASDALTAGYIGAGTQLLTAGTRLYANRAGGPTESLGNTQNYMGSLTYGGPR